LWNLAEEIRERGEGDIVIEVQSMNVVELNGEREGTQS